MMEALQFEFMRNALAAGLLVSLACGVIGVFVVLNRMVFISAGIAHAAYGGIGLGYFCGFNPVVGATFFSLFAAMAMGAVERNTRQRVDTLIGVMWAVGMAVGILLIDLTDGYKADLMSYLFGSILTVPTGDLWIMLGLDVVVLSLTACLYKELLGLSFDETFTTVQNVPVERIYIALICLIGLAVVMMMRVVGLILVIALLTIPAAVAGMWVKEMRSMMVLAALLSAVFTTAGLAASYAFDLTSGATIILMSAIAYLASLALTEWRRRRGRG